MAAKRTPPVLVALALLCGAAPPARFQHQAQARPQSQLQTQLPPPAAGAERTDALLEALDDADPKRAQEAFRELSEQSDPRRLFEGWSAAGSAGRRARAELVRLHGAGPELDAVLQRVADPDPRVRLSLIAFLGRADVAPAALADGRDERRIAALTERAFHDVRSDLRQAALEALARLDSPAALAVLLRATEELERSDAVGAARQLVQSPHSGKLVLERVRDAFGETSSAARRPRDGVLAVLLVAYGRLLAEQAGGGETARERAPLVLGARHPSPAVQSGARLGFEALVDRLRGLRQIERADRVLELFAEQGFESRVVTFERALTALRHGSNPRRAEPALEELERATGHRSRLDERRWRARASYLKALVELATRELEQTLRYADESARLYDGLAAERLDLGHAERRLDHVEILAERAQVELLGALCALAGGAEVTDALVLEPLRAAHVLMLESQLGAVRADREGPSSWDDLLNSPSSPRSTVLGNRENAAWSVEQLIDLQDDLARAISVVSPEELPGIELRGAEGRLVKELPARLTQPFRDPERFELSIAIQRARADRIRVEMRRQRALLERQRQVNGDVVEPRNLERQRVLWNQLQVVLDALERAQEGDFGDLREIRLPSTAALELAQLYQNEGQPVVARQLAERMLKDIEDSGFAHRPPAGPELVAEISMTIGQTWTDEDEPLAAEVELLKAVERLADTEKFLREWNARSASIRRIEIMRSRALVSLAVNANVKLGDPDKALDYFERAFALRQDDWMKVLLACYRARSGLEDEARRVLSEVRPAPSLYYNLACTYALLGDSEPALEFLERELEENHPRKASLERQKEWARDDPDLSSLAEDPRFEHLVRPGE